MFGRAKGVKLMQSSLKSFELDYYGLILGGGVIILKLLVTLRLQSSATNKTHLTKLVDNLTDELANGDEIAHRKAERYWHCACH